MERVAFLIEDTNQRIGCLLNPESLIIRRRAGVRARQSAGGLVTGADLADDQLLYSGGGNTELTMNLLFGVSLAGSSVPLADGNTVTATTGYIAESIRSPDAKIVAGFTPGLMQVVSLTDEEIQALVAYISSR